MGAYLDQGPPMKGHFGGKTRYGFYLLRGIPPPTHANTSAMTSTHHELSIAGFKPRNGGL